MWEVIIKTWPKDLHRQSQPIQLLELSPGGLLVSYCHVNSKNRAAMVQQKVTAFCDHFLTCEVLTSNS